MSVDIEGLRRLIRALERETAETPCHCHNGRTYWADCPRHGDDGPAERLGEARYDLEQVRS